MKKIDVSILVLTYNHDKYLRQALESIFMQKTTYKYEVLIINNGSNDGTGTIIEEFYLKNPGIVRVITKKEKISPTKCSLEAMQQCKGRYLASCEGDDFWLDENKIQRQIDFLEENKEYVGCTHPVLLVNELGDIASRKRLYWVSNCKRYRLKDYDGLRLPGHISSFIRRNLFLNSDFDASLIPEASLFIGDRTNFLLWLEQGDIYRLKNKMSAYRVRTKEESLTQSLYATNKEHSRSEFDLINKIDEYISLKNIKISLTKRYLAIYADCIYDLFKYGEDADKTLPSEIRKKIGSVLCNLSLPFFLLGKFVKRFMYYY